MDYLTIGGLIQGKLKKVGDTVHRCPDSNSYWYRFSTPYWLKKSSDKYLDYCLLIPKPDKLVFISLLCLGILCILSLPSWGQDRKLSQQIIFKKIGRQQADAFLEDSWGFIWIGGSEGLFRYDGYSIQPYRPPIQNNSVQSTGAVYALLEDSKKRIWVGASNGLFRYDREKEALIGYLVDYPTFVHKDSRILSVLEDHSGRLWIGGRQHLFVMENIDNPEFQTIEGIALGTRRQGALGFSSILESPEGEIFAFSNNSLWLICDDFSHQQFLPPKWQNAIGEFQVLDAAADEKGIFWLATTDGLWTFDPEKRFFSKKEIPLTAGNVILQVLIGNDNEVWLGTQNKGLLKFKEGDFEHFSHDSDNAYGLNDYRVQSLLIDRFDNLWIGTMFGINQVNFRQQKFPFYQIDPGPNRQDNFTFRVMEDSLGGFWFRLLRLGLGYCPGTGEKLEVLLQPASKSFIEEIKNFCLDPDGNVWVITLTNGVYYFEKGRKEYRHVDLGDSMENAYAYTILSDRKDSEYLWFSTRFGLCRLNRFTLEQHWFYPRDDLEWIDDNSLGPLEQSEDGTLWCTLRAKGINRIGYFDREKGKFVAEPNLPGHPSFPTHNSTRHIKSVPSNKIWVGTDNGVIIIDATSNTYDHLTEKEGLPVKSVESVTPDLEGNIWFTGRNKICKYDGADYQCFEVKDGIEYFMYWSAALGKDGRVTFGGSNGIYSFYPNEIAFEQDTIKPKVYLTNFKVFNKERHLGKAYELVREITLPYEDNIFSFEFAGLHFTQSEKLRYKYRLENFDKDTVETSSNERVATYTNLSPGTYTFKVWAATADGAWTAEEDSLNVKLTVIPPWYRTWWAYTLWALLLLGILYAIYCFQLNRKLTMVEARRLRELDETKNRIYANITHQFRTPLTLILGMADKIEEAPGRWLKNGVRAIRNNSSNLLRLVRQMLDLSRLEAGQLPLRSGQGDVISFLRLIMELYRSNAEVKGIVMSFQTEAEELVMDYDPDKLADIVSNLLSNALKFTPAGGLVTVSIKPYAVGNGLGGLTAADYLQLTVQDTGPGIPPEQLPHIFDRFYQGDDAAMQRGEGTGIGLTLAAELAKLLGGALEAQSVLGQGAVFRLHLPIRNTAPMLTALPTLGPDIAERVPVLKPTAAPTAGQRPLALIVEDNSEVSAYLVTCLQGHYRLKTAADGQAGVERAIELVPDVIISDVIMPKMDGFELCRTLKEDARTSHIPIVLLTALADTASRVKGLEVGADAYLSKPFNQRELEVCLRKSLELRHRLRQRYAGGKVPDQPEIEFSREDAFVASLQAFLEANYHEEELSIVEMANALHFSHRQLGRKVKGLFGITPQLYLRRFRLEKARHLLRTTDRTITEIAHSTGFSSLAYFSRVFLDEFGVPPGEWRVG